MNDLEAQGLILAVVIFCSGVLAGWLAREVVSRHGRLRKMERDLDAIERDISKLDKQVEQRRWKDI